MILQALNRYYDVLAADPESGIPPYGYSIANVSFALNLSEEGELLDIFRLYEKVERGKNKKIVEVPRRMIVPAHGKRSSGISANFLCDSSAYVLGISDKDEKKPGYTIDRFEAFRAWNIELLSRADCVEARAVITFLEHFDPQHSREHPVVAGQVESILSETGNLVFKLEGRKGYVHEAEDIRRVWGAYKADPGDAETGQCLVTGEIAPIARIHGSLKGVVGAQSSGATLVGFNAPAYESYNRTKGQGLNSPTSERAAFAYTTVLNFLLSRDNDYANIRIGDTTIVYWAESTDPAYQATVSFLLNPALQDQEKEETQTAPRDKTGDLRLHEIAQRVRMAAYLDAGKLLEGIDETTRFYVLGLAPNAARVSVRFFHTDSFQKVVKKILMHYQDLQIEKEFENQPTYIPLWQLLRETVSQKASSPQVSPLLGGAVMRAIFSGGPYPAAFYTAILTRIRADMDDKDKRIEKINYVRAAIIKACLIRKYRNQPKHPIQEVIIMGLNEQSTNHAYLLGRLFAVLEKAQRDAIGKANASIKDRYFTSACATPASVFPVLLRLSQHHISKAEYGYVNDNRIAEIMNRLDVENDPIPARLSLDEQGIFVLGYYQQRMAFYKKTNPDVSDETDETSEINQ